MKKLLVIFGAVAFALVGASMFAAFEAHVINVTATIENALSVPATPIIFGTVFPQEHLNQPLTIGLSGSFIDEKRVDNVDYVIRQKPKCAWSWQDQNLVWHIDENSTATGEVVPNQTAAGYTIDCNNAAHLTPPAGVIGNATWGVLPSLCQYISKESPRRDTDVSISSFHQPFTVSHGVVNWLDAKGHLSKSGQATSTTWTIDLAVPCFGGYCAQDWLKFVRDISGNQQLTQQEADAYTQPKELEHKVFGCDLWVEVTGVSQTSVPPPAGPLT